MGEQHLNGPADGNDPLAQLLRLDAQCEFELPDDGFTTRVMNGLPPRHESSEARWALALFHLVGISVATMAAFRGLADFMVSVTKAAWWLSPDIWVLSFAPLVVLSWLSISFAREIVE
jgi:hypothetical protein